MNTEESKKTWDLLSEADLVLMTESLEKIAKVYAAAMPEFIIGSLLDGIPSEIKQKAEMDIRRSINKVSNEHQSKLEDVRLLLGKLIMIKRNLKENEMAKDINEVLSKTNSNGDQQ
jgi:hypothetical protein